MADSSFDPLALVKAMGPQRDPYSWAELYAADASKQQVLREEIKNRLLIQDKEEKARSKEHALDRGSRMSIAEYQQREASKRAKLRSDDYRARLSRAEEDIDWPVGSMSEKEFADQKILNPRLDETKFQRVTRGKHTKLVPLGSTPTRSSVPRSVLPAPNPFEED